VASLEVGKLLTSTLDLREILDRIMNRMSELIHAQNWSLLLKYEATGDLIFEILLGADRALYAVKRSTKNGVGTL